MDGQDPVLPLAPLGQARITHTARDVHQYEPSSSVIADASLELADVRPDDVVTVGRDEEHALGRADVVDHDAQLLGVVARGNVLPLRGEIGVEDAFGTETKDGKDAERESSTVSRVF
jgi:hypothetical protein